MSSSAECTGGMRREAARKACMQWCARMQILARARPQLDPHLGPAQRPCSGLHAGLLHVPAAVRQLARAAQRVHRERHVRHRLGGHLHAGWGTTSRIHTI